MIRNILGYIFILALLVGVPILVVYVYTYFDLKSREYKG